jgi:tetratricopeptide (TPR) repeat protein
MRKAVHAGIVIVLVACLFCSCTTYSIYSRDVLAGKNLISEKKYDKARSHLTEAARYNIDGAAFTYLAVAAYRQGDLEAARDYIASAEKAPPDMLTSLRMYGYKALILIGLKDPGALKALKEYTDRYDSFYPLESIKDIKTMWRTGAVDGPRLTAIIEEQLMIHEQDLELYIYNKVGFYARDNREGAD